MKERRALAKEVKVKPSSPGVVFLCLLSIFSSSRKVKSLFVSAFFCFAAANFDCLNGNCFFRAVMMFLGRVVWSALVVKWLASVLTSIFGFMVLAVGAYPFIF